MAEKFNMEQAEDLKAGIEKQYAVTKSLGLNQAAQMFLSGEDMPDSKPSKPTRPYAQVELVFACVNKLIDAVAGIPAVISTGDDNIVESGPVYDLLFNNRTSWTRFVTETIGHYALSRDVFWLFTEMNGVRPKSITVVSGTQMHAVTHDGTSRGALIGWEFRSLHGKRARFGLNEVHQWKNFNPYNKFHGIGPAQASKLSMDYSFAASLYAASSLDNAAEPGAMLLAEGKLDADQIRLLRSQFDSRHKGAGNTKKTAVLSGIKDVKTIAMNMANMQVAKISQMSDNKICSCFGVPPSLVGLATEAQYSHGPAQRDFIFNTVMPLCRLFAGELNTGVLARHYPSQQRAVNIKDSRLYRDRAVKLNRKSSYRHALQKAIVENQSLFLWFDSDQHPVVQEYMRETAEKVLKFREAGIRLNDIIAAHDLPYGEVPWGNDWFVPMGLVPANYILEGGIETVTGPSLPEPPEDEDGGEESKELKEIVSHLITKDTEQAKLRIWRNWVVSWAGIEKEFDGVVRMFFVRQQRVLTDKLKKAWSQLGNEKTVNKDASDIIARVVFDLKIENQKIKVINHTFFEKASELGIRQGVSEVAGLSGEQLDELTERIKRKPVIKAKLVISTEKITHINKTTQDIVAKQLRQGLEAGEGLNELTNRIKSVTGKSLGRARSIARTQTAGAVGTGRHEGMKSAGTELKGWLDSRDETVRPSHRTAGQIYAKGIAIDLPFNIGGEMLMYPGDPSGSAANIINCRCAEIAIVAQGKSFGLNYYSNVKFYSYSDMQMAWESKTKEKDHKNEEQ